MVVDHCVGVVRPEIPPSNGWTKHYTLRWLARKGGYRRIYDAQAAARTRVERFQSSSQSASWDAYERCLKRLK
jgi:AMMECR1 domain-containing protein